jgi:hypothetical protein
MKEKKKNNAKTKKIISIMTWTGCCKKKIAKR